MIGVRRGAHCVYLVLHDTVPNAFGLDKSLEEL
jgi:hypothetical protein